MPVLTLEVLTWLMRFSCSGFTSTTTLMFHSACMATCGGGPPAEPLSTPPPRWTPQHPQCHETTQHPETTPNHRSQSIPSIPETTPSTLRPPSAP